jgi:SnoaL-like domain
MTPPQPPSLTTLIATLTRYRAAWHEPDAEVRRAHLLAIWASDGLFVDPQVRLVGPDAVLAHIAHVRSEFVGASFALASGIDLHHDVFRYQWHMLDAGGDVRLQGLDIGQLDATGRIARLIGFFGPFPALPSRAEAV